MVQNATVLPESVGLDRVTGYLDGGMHGWNLAGLPTEHLGQLNPQEFHRLVQIKSDMLLVEIHSVPEFRRLSVCGSLNIPAPDLRSRHMGLPKDMPIVVIRSSGMRSSLVASILESRGFKDVKSVAGGISGYVAAGFAG